MWSGPVTSFSKKIEEIQEDSAYALGSKAYIAGKSMSNHFVAGSEADAEWVDGYLDAMYIHNMCKVSKYD